MRFHQRILILLLIGIMLSLLTTSFVSRVAFPASSSTSTQHHRCSKTNGIQKKVRIKKDLNTYLLGLIRDAPFTADSVDAFRHYTIARKDIAPLSADKALRPGFGSPINDVTGYHYPININPCRKSSSDQVKSLFVAIISAVGYTENRNIIRRTWFKHFSNHSETIDLVGFGFIVGRSFNSTIQKALELESSVHGDIIQVDVIDSYASLTSKTVATVNWLNLYCSAVDFAMKVDDDVYVNIHNLAATLPTLRRYDEASIFGSEIKNNPVQRDKKVEKWAVSYEEWPWADQPTFLQGGNILITGKAIAPLLAAAQVMPFVQSEDVYLSGLCASKARVPLFVHERVRRDGCYVRETISWLTDSIKQMLDSHKLVERFYNGKAKCRIRHSSSETDVIYSQSVGPENNTKFKFVRVY